MKIWRCPMCLESGVRAPTAMRRDDVRRFCLDCSQRTGFLVSRVNVTAANRKAAREAKERTDRDNARQAREALHRSVVAPSSALISPAGVMLDVLESGRRDLMELLSDHESGTLQVSELRRLIDLAIASKVARFPRRKIVAMFAATPSGQWCHGYGIVVRYTGEFQYHCLFCEEMPFTLGKVGSTISLEFSNRIRQHGAICAMQYLVMLDHDFSNAVKPVSGAT